MKNKILWILAAVVLYLGAQIAIAASENTAQKDNLSKEARVRTLGASRVASLTVMGNTSASRDDRVKKMAPPAQSKMRSADPSDSPGTTAPLQKTETQKDQPNYVPYVIVLALGIVAGLFIYRSRRK